MRYWIFDANTCRFERANRQVDLHTADVVIVNDNTGVYVICDNRSLERWPSGETLSVAGVEFEREEFE